MWTAPRCISTAFERCVMEIPGGKVFHEPYTSAYYFGPERSSRRYLDQEADHSQSYSAVTDRLAADYPEKNYVFVKDMAYSVAGRYQMLVEDERLAGVRHSFLIRDPMKAIASLYKASTHSARTGWTYFDKAEAGFQELHDLYVAVDSAQHGGQGAPVVVDCEDLLAFPDETMKAYCDAVGLQYKPGMTSWQPGPQPDWDIWNGWHDDALQSSGFQRTTPTDHRRGEQLELSAEVKQLADQAMPLYLSLYDKRIRPAISS